MIETIYTDNGQNKRLEISCDNCGESFVADTFEDAIMEMKAMGWLNEKESIDGKDEWFQACPDCQ